MFTSNGFIQRESGDIWSAEFAIKGAIRQLSAKVCDNEVPLFDKTVATLTYSSVTELQSKKNYSATICSDNLFITLEDGTTIRAQFKTSVPCLWPTVSGSGTWFTDGPTGGAGASASTDADTPSQTCQVSHPRKKRDSTNKVLRRYAEETIEPRRWRKLEEQPARLPNPQPSRGHYPEDQPGSNSRSSFNPW